MTMRLDRIRSSGDDSTRRIVATGTGRLIGGVLLFTLADAWRHSRIQLPYISVAWNDILDGLLFGIAIIVEISAVAILASAIRARRR